MLQRLDIDEREVEEAPPITETLQSCFGPTYKAQSIQYLAASDSVGAKTFLRFWRQIPKADHQELTIEVVCVYARVSPLEILGAVLMAARNLKGQESALKAILAHPEVVEATVASATQGTPLLIDGKPYLDENGRPLLIGHGNAAAQKMMHEAVGFLPTRKGSEVEINFFGRKADKDDDDEIDDDEAAWDEAFPLISGKLEKWSEKRRKLTEGN